MKEIIYYILAAIGGGVVSELNSNTETPKNFKYIFIRGFTSVMIGIIFGLTFESITGNVKLTIVITALAGVGGYASIIWIGDLFKRQVNKIINKEEDTNPPPNG